LKSTARDQLTGIDQRITDLERLKATIEECLDCGCQHARRCKLLTMPAATAVTRPSPARTR